MPAADIARPPGQVAGHKWPDRGFLVAWGRVDAAADIWVAMKRAGITGQALDMVDEKARAYQAEYEAIMDGGEQ